MSLHVVSQRLERKPATNRHRRQTIPHFSGLFRKKA
jgi:hypothetical protein